MLSQGFQNLLAEVSEVSNDCLAGRVRMVEAVVDVQPVGCGGTGKFAQVEVFGKFPMGKSMDFTLVWDGYDLITNLSRIVNVI